MLWSSSSSIQSGGTPAPWAAARRWSNKRMGDRAGRMPNMSQGVSRSGGAGPLDPATAALVRLAAGGAGGALPQLHQRPPPAPGAGVPPLWIGQLLLPSMLVGGLPPALVAFRVG